MDWLTGKEGKERACAPESAVDDGGGRRPEAVTSPARGRELEAES